MKKKLALLATLTLCVISINAQRNDIKLIEETPGVYYQSNLHTNGEMLYMESSNYNNVKLFVYNSSTNTGQTISLKDNDDLVVFPTYFFNKNGLTYYVVQTEKNSTRTMNIYELDGSKYRVFRYQDLSADTILMGRNHILAPGSSQNAHIVLAFNTTTLKYNNLGKYDRSHRTYALGDTLILSSTHTENKTIAVDASGNSWTIASPSVAMEINSLPFEGYLYFYGPDDDIYRTTGASGSIEKVLDLENHALDAKMKRLKSGLVFYYKDDGIHFLANGTTKPILISEDSFYWNDPVQLDNSHIAVYQKKKLHILNIQKNDVEKVSFIKGHSYSRGLVSSLADKEVFMAITDQKQNDQFQDIYGYDAKGTLARYTSQSIDLNKEGYINGVVQINGMIFYILRKDTDYSLHALPSKAVSYAKMLKVRAFVDDNKNGRFDEGEDLFNDVVLRDETAKVHYYLSNGHGTIGVFKGAKKFRVLSKPTWAFSTDSVFKFELHKFSHDTLLDVGLMRLRRVASIDGITTNARMRCGFPVWMQHKVINDGNINFYSGVRVQYDSLLNIDSFSITPDTINNYELYWNLDSLSFNSYNKVRTFFRVPGVDFNGEYLDFKITYEGRDAFGEPLRQQDSLRLEIRCAYDPNDKMVWPNRKDLDNQTLFNESLTYRIRFQNTGTDTAFNIVVSDTLSSLLDWSTFKVVEHSHPMRTKRYDDGTVNFIFDDILLPDSNINEPESHGYIYYRIKPKKGLKENDEIFNTAYIYFDYNPPIVTDTTRNLMVSKIIYDGIPQSPASLPLRVYPIPVQNALNIQIQNLETAQIKLLDINGKQVINETAVGRNHTINVSKLPSGIYLLQVQQGEQIYQTKFSKI